MPKNYKIKQTTCSHCGAEKPGNELFQYVDGNNAAITRNSPLLCRSCYAKQYPDLY